MSVVSWSFCRNDGNDGNDQKIVYCVWLAEALERSQAAVKVEVGHVTCLGVHLVYWKQRIASFGCCEWCCQCTLLGFRFYLQYLSTEPGLRWERLAARSFIVRCLWLYLCHRWFVCRSVDLFQSRKGTKNHKDPQRPTKTHKIPKKNAQSWRVRKWSSHTATTKMRPR